MNSTKSTPLLIAGSIVVLLAMKRVFFSGKFLTKNDSSKSKSSSLTSTQIVQEMDSAGLTNRVLRKAETVIQGRTSRMVVVVERCTDDHNYSAIIRTAEALGIQHIWLIDPVISLEQSEIEEGSIKQESVLKNDQEDTDNLIFEKHSDKVRYEHGKFAKRATEWVTLREFRTSGECIAALRKDNRTIWATDLSQKACCLTRHLPFDESSQSVIPQRLAIVFGTESVGVTEEILEAADLRVYLPLRGFADSLNLSVAAALVIQHVFHLDPTVIGDITEQEKTELRQLWFPKMVADRAGSASIKRELRKIAHSLRDIDAIKEKLLFIESNAASSQKEDDKQNNSHHNINKYELSKEQLLKLSNEKTLLLREHEINDKIWKESERAVQEAIRNPPKPLTDVRRCDEHRTAFVGSNVRKQNAAHWKGMAATANHKGLPNPDAVPRVNPSQSVPV